MCLFCDGFRSKRLGYPCLWSHFSPQWKLAGGWRLLWEGWRPPNLREYQANMLFLMFQGDLFHFDSQILCYSWWWLCLQSNLSILCSCQHNDPSFHQADHPTYCQKWLHRWHILPIFCSQSVAEDNVYGTYANTQEEVRHRQTHLRVLFRVLLFRILQDRSYIFNPPFYICQARIQEKGSNLFRRHHDTFSAPVYFSRWWGRSQRALPQSILTMDRQYSGYSIALPFPFQIPFSPKNLLTSFLFRTSAWTATLSPLI